MVRMGTRRLVLGLPLALVFSVVPMASAQTTTSNQAAVTLNATLAASISVSTSASSYNWASLTAGGTTNAAAPVTITTAWVLSSGTTIELDAFFATPAHAMTDGNSNYIPASAIFGTVSGADTVASTALNATTTLGGASSGLTLFTYTMSSLNANRVDTLALSIHLNGLSIPAGTYVGTLTFQAQAM